MRRNHFEPVQLVLTGVLTVLLMLSLPALAQDSDAAGESAPPHTDEGADDCLACHDEQDGDFPVLSIFDTAHAVVADERTPFAGAQCEACHGPGGEHGKRLRFGEERPPIPGFGEKSQWSSERENQVCLDCHDEQDHAWKGGVHERQEIACVDCHTLHEKRDPVTVTEEQPRVCYQCHTEQRARMHQARAHPVRQGKMDCADCHEPHGSLSDAMLDEPTVNENCYQCHAEKRGPYLWEHAPASEDCTLCHEPHGSNHPGMLTQRAPLMCQQCHSRLGHPSIGRTGNDLPSGNPSAFQLQGSCMNCHSQVHGSNHPSGANLSR